MRKTITLISIIAVMALAMVGCGSESISPLTSSPQLFNAPGIPSDATINSAELHIFSASNDTQMVSIHLANTAWDESTVTWNSFGAAYDVTPVGVATVFNGGWSVLDISGAVNAWFDGTSENFGLLLHPEDSNIVTSAFVSREGILTAPFAVVCYTAGAVDICDTFDLDADASLYSITPDVNLGAVPILTVAYQDNFGTYMSLLAFDLPVVDPEPELGSVSNFLWFDDNGDGIQDSTELGAAEYKVTLYDCDSNEVAATATDADGFYMFDSIPAGSYIVQFIAGMNEFSPKDAGADDALDSDVNPESGFTDCFELLAGENKDDIDAGLLVEIVYDGCTRSKGYWKNHAGFGPQDDVLSELLPISLGSFEIADAQMAVDVLQQHTYGHPSNGITKLYAQLLAAKLNIASNADPADVDDVISDADDFLSNYTHEDWESLDDDQRHMVGDWKGILGDYNEGEIGPGHCDDCDHEDDDDCDDEEEDEGDDDGDDN